MKQRVSMNEASNLLGIPQQRIRVLMRKGLLDIGECIPPESRNGRWSYLIYREKVNKVIGVTNNEI